MNTIITSSYTRGVLQDLTVDTLTANDIQTETGSIAVLVIGNLQTNQISSTGNLNINSNQVLFNSTGGVNSATIDNETQNATFSNMLITGNLQVNGTTTIVDKIETTDPLLYLGVNNTGGDTLDSGWQATYNSGGTIVYNGVFRKHGTNDIYLYSNQQTGSTGDMMPSTINKANLVCNNISAYAIIGSEIAAPIVLSSYLTCSSGNFQNTISTGSNLSDSLISNCTGSLNNVIITSSSFTGSISGGTITNTAITNSSIDSSNIGATSSGSLVFTNGTGTNLTCLTITANTGTFTNLNAPSVSGSNLLWTNATGFNTYTNNLVAPNITGTTLTLGSTVINETTINSTGNLQINPTSFLGIGVSPATYLDVSKNLGTNTGSVSVQLDSQSSYPRLGFQGSKLSLGTTSGYNQNLVGFTEQTSLDNLGNLTAVGQVTGKYLSSALSSSVGTSLNVGTTLTAPTMSGNHLIASNITVPSFNTSNNFVITDSAGNFGSTTAECSGANVVTTHGVGTTIWLMNDFNPTYTEPNFTNFCLNGAGTQANPSYSFTSNTGTGMWSSSADTLNFTAGGTNIVQATNTVYTHTTGTVYLGTAGLTDGERMRINGQTSQSYISFYGGNNAGSTREGYLGTYTGQGMILNSSDTTGGLHFQTQNLDRMVIDSAGNVGIHTTAIITDVATINCQYSTIGLGVRYDDSFPNIRGQIVHGGNLGGINSLGGLQICAQGSNNSDQGSSNIIFLNSAVNSATSTGDATLIERMRIDSSGNVGIGGTPSHLFNVISGNNSLFWEPNSGNPYALMTSTGGVQLGLGAQATTQVNIGAVSNHHTCIISNNSTVITAIGGVGATGGTTGITFNQYGAGTLITDSSGNVLAVSDRQTKNTITYMSDYSLTGYTGNPTGTAVVSWTGANPTLPYTGSLGIVSQLKPCFFDRNSDSFKGYVGFIAQDVEEVIPEAIDGKKHSFQPLKDATGNVCFDATGNMLFTDIPRFRTLDTTAILAHAVKAIQEQQNQIQSLQSQLCTLLHP